MTVKVSYQEGETATQNLINIGIRDIFSFFDKD